MKIYDEKQRQDHGGTLKFYINDDEYYTGTLNKREVQNFVERMKNLYKEAKIYYSNILGDNNIKWEREKHVKVANEIVKQFQDYSFVRSSNNDLYQLIFYNFATKFQKDEKGQFLTPLPIIDFIVKIVNPKAGETICDPCCGIADFLSKSYINADMKLDDCQLYGFDNDYNMTVLAQLNMLLNGDGNAVIKYMPEYGSITQKLTTDKKVALLDNAIHSSGEWNKWYDETELMEYDVILTNPPFGKNRSLDLSNSHDVEVAKLYELYDRYTETNPKAGLDKGVVFLENAIRQIKEGGRFAIVLSNAIMSNNTWAFARDWVMEKIRVVALFDLPENVFAETGVNTTNNGYHVTATDGSGVICKMATDYTGIQVKQMLFEELDDRNQYDGIWACASVLHLSREKLPNIFHKMHQALKTNGIIYTSFKYGTFEGERNGRYFTDFTEVMFEKFAKQISGLQIEKMWITGDVREGRGDERWLNILLRKTDVC